MITVHHLENSRSQRILWMLEELGLEYQITLYKRDPKTNLAPKSLKQIHPLGKSPVITDGDITVAETGAIVQYLCDTYAKKRVPKKGSALDRDYTYWMHYAEGTLMPFMVLSLIMDKIKTGPMPFFVRPIAGKISDAVMESYVSPNITTNLEFIESYLNGKMWFIGDDWTGVDVQMIFPLEALLAKGGILEAYPNIKSYVNRIHALKTYQKALEKGGPYDYA